MEARIEKENKTARVLLGSSISLFGFFLVIESLNCFTREDWDSCMLEPNARPFYLAFLFECFFIGILHEIGKENRPGSNAIHKTTAFVKSSMASLFRNPHEIRKNVAEEDVANGYRNIINGGATVYDQFKG